MCIPGSYGYGILTELTEVPGTGMKALQNPQKFRVGTRMLYPCPYPYPDILQGHTRTPGIVTRAYRTYRNSGYGHERLTELTQVPVRAIPGKYPGNGSMRTLQNTTFDSDFVETHVCKLRVVL